MIGMTYPTKETLFPILLVILSSGCERSVGAGDNSNTNVNTNNSACVELGEIDCLASPDCLAVYDGSTFLECIPLPEVTCPPSRTISSGTDLVAALAEVIETPWPTGNTWASGRFILTPDLEVSTTMTVDASQLAALHPGCNTRYPGVCEPLRFKLASTAVNADIPGVTFSGEEWSYNMTDPTITGAYPTMTIDAGTTVRLAFKVYTRGNQTPIHLIELYTPCPETCSTNSLRCPYGPLCYSPGDLYCRRCHEGPQPTCACQGTDGTETDGTHCSYLLSSEIQSSGTCEEGVCVTDSTW